MDLFWDVSGCTIVTGSGTWTTLNSIYSYGPLQNNGGPTPTNALLRGSNAINTTQGCIGSNSQPLATDQRGAPWVFGVSCDFGAYEYRSPLVLPLILR